MVCTLASGPLLRTATFEVVYLCVSTVRFNVCEGEWGPGISVSGCGSEINLAARSKRNNPLHQSTHHSGILITGLLLRGQGFEPVVNAASEFLGFLNDLGSNR